MYALLHKPPCVPNTETHSILATQSLIPKTHSDGATQSLIPIQTYNYADWAVTYNIIILIVEDSEVIVN